MTIIHLLVGKEVFIQRIPLVLFFFLVVFSQTKVNIYDYEQVIVCNFNDAHTYLPTFTYKKNYESNVELYNE